MNHLKRTSCFSLSKMSFLNSLILDWFPTIADLVNPRFPFRGDGVSHKRALFNINDHSPRQNMIYDVTSNHVVLRQENLKFYFNMELGISPSDWSPPPEGKHGFHLEALFKLYENRETQNIDNGLKIGGRTVYLFDLQHDPLELINIGKVTTIVTIISNEHFSERSTRENRRIETSGCWTP